MLSVSLIFRNFSRSVGVYGFKGHVKGVFKN